MLSGEELTTNSRNSLDRFARDLLLTQLEVTIHPLIQLPAVLDG